MVAAYNVLQQTGPATYGSSWRYFFSRVGRLLSVAFARVNGVSP